MTMVEFTVLGVPQPQGSKVKTRFGGIREANNALPAWREMVIRAAIRAMTEQPDAYPICRPVVVEMDCYFTRPRSHYGSGRNAGIVRAGAPGLAHAQKPDLDKLQRAVGDALTIAGTLRDDSLITGWNARKYWHDTAFMSVLVASEEM